ncbi:MAG: DUF4910 domain-containing protein [Chloroflexia bacterium]
MLERTVQLFREAVSGRAALQDLGQIVTFHRIQSSPGFREAARFCATRLREAGIQTQVLSFPADGVTEFWGYPIPQEWHAQSAVLRLVSPEREARTLADYREDKISLIQRSLATPPEGIETDLVVLEDGEEEGAYEGLDLRGKMVLARGDLERVRDLAVERHGAIGIVYDGMREAPPVRPLMSLDARQYTSFWWADGETRCFGFVLSPHQGEWLRRLARAEAREGRSIRLYAEVDASFYAGHMEVVEGFLPGETEEEVWLIAHLCHPQPSANDNASGAATLLEVARALSALRAAGKIPPFRRGIRFLLVPEMTGTYAYLATHETSIPRVVAALNLDMVGEDQAQCGSTLNLTQAPLSAPSVCDDLLAQIVQTIAAEGEGFMGTTQYALFRWTEAPFSAGSDHYILTDPTVGIPCPMMLQWPDRFYHTDADTIDKVDPEMLARVGVAAATYLWWFATAGAREAWWLGQALVRRAEARMGQIVQGWLDGLLSRDPVPSPGELARERDRLARKVQLLVEHRVASLGQLERLAGGPLAQRAEWESSLSAARLRELNRAEEALRELFGGLLPAPEQHQADEWEEKAGRLVPRRVYRGPFSLRHRLQRLSPEERDALRPLLKELGHSVAPTLAMYWTDGRRTLLEIADRVEAECGVRDVQKLLQYYELAARTGLVVFEEAQ